jgi:DNA-binding beta-propeller fold protein YncE
MARGVLVAAIAAIAVATAASDARACTGAECYVQAATLGEAPATGSSVLRFPQAIAYDVSIDAGEPRQLYVADNNNHRVQAFDFATLAFQRTWGQFGTEVGDFGFTRVLAAVADDPVGGVAVADTANNRVQTFAPDGGPTARRLIFTVAAGR